MWTQINIAKETKQKIQVLLPTSIYQKIENLAEESWLSISAYTRVLVLLAFKKQQDLSDLLPNEEEEKEEINTEDYKVETE